MAGPIRLVSPGGATVAELHPELNLLTASLTHAGTELLDPAQGVEAYRERGATLGIPLLHPWANRLEGFAYDAAGVHVELPEDAPIPRDPNGLPIHGIEPALLAWAVDEHEDARLTASLDFSDPDLLGLFPYPHRLTTEVTVADGAITLVTTVTPAGDQPVPVSFGYHPYLRLPGGDRSAWEVELGARRHLTLDERLIPTGAAEPLRTPSFALAGESLDDAYDGVDSGGRFRARSEHGEITVEFRRGYPYAQVYAPPEQDFICFEPMTAPGNALCSGDGLTVVAPGDSYTAAFSVAVVLP